MNSDINWQEIVDEVFYNNYVKGDPSKFLNALEDVLEEKGYQGPINPDRPNNFGNPGGEYFERIKKNYNAIQGLESDKINRPLDRYIMQDILVDKFFNGDKEAAGKAYQEWILSRGKIRKHHDSAGRDVFLIPKIEDLPIWTPNGDVVDQPMYGFFIDHLFGGKHYTSYKDQDKKKKEDEEYRENRDEGKYRDVCPQCRGNTYMPWVSSDADYPKGMISKSEVCKRCNPDGERPSKMSDSSSRYGCDICKSPGFPGVYDKNHFSYNDTIKNIEYWKMRLAGEERTAQQMLANPDRYESYFENLNGRPVNGEKIEEAKKRLEEYENQLYKPGQKCDCSFETLKDVHDRYVQFEDYESLENMKKNKLYDWFFEELNKTQNLNESIERIKTIMRLL